jgi:hypothetical protein
MARRVIEEQLRQARGIMTGQYSISFVISCLLLLLRCFDYSNENFAKKEVKHVDADQNRTVLTMNCITQVTS